MADGTNDHSHTIIFSLPSKETDLEKKVMWVGVKNHVAGDEKMMGVRSDFHLHLKEGEKIGWLILEGDIAILQNTY